MSMPRWSRKYSCAVLAGAAALLPCAGSASAQVILNEVCLYPERVGAPDASWQYIELLGAPNLDLTGLAVVVITAGQDRDADGIPEFPSRIDEAFSLDGLRLAPSGILALYNDTDTSRPSGVLPLLTPNPGFNPQQPPSLTNLRSLEGVPFSLTSIRKPQGAPTTDLDLPDTPGSLEGQRPVTVLLVRRRPGLSPTGEASPQYAIRRGVAVDVNADGRLDFGDEATLGVTASSDPIETGLVNPGVIRSFLADAFRRRVDVALIGDSNTRFGGAYGNEYGMTQAWAEGPGLYASRVDPMGGAGGWGPMIGGMRTGVSEADGWFVNFGAPSELAQLSFPAESGAPSGYIYLPPGATVPDTAIVRNASLVPLYPLPPNGELRWTMRTGTFEGVDNGVLGRFNPTVRALISGYENYATTDPFGVATITGALGLRDVDLEVPPGVRDQYGIELALWKLDGQDVRGPFFGMWSRIEDRAASSGVGFSTLLYQGGLSSFHASRSVNAGFTQAQMNEWFRAVTRLQSLDQAQHKLLVQILHGGNDRTDTNPSIGPITVDPPLSYLPEGHKNNLLGIIDGLRAFWINAGYDPENLSFLLGPYHPVQQYVTQLRGYEDAWMQIAQERPNVSVLLGTRISTPQEFGDGQWYVGSDTAHLSQRGNRHWGWRTLQTLSRATTPPPRAIAPMQVLDAVAVEDSGAPALTPSNDTRLTRQLTVVPGVEPLLPDAFSRVAYYPSNPSRRKRVSSAARRRPTSRG
jgi:hypothetical protein